MSRFNDLTIGQRLAIGFSALLLLLGALLGGIYAWEVDSTRAQNDFARRSLPLVEAAANVEDGILRVALALRAYMLEPSAERLERYAENASVVRLRLQSLQALTRNATDRALLSEIAPMVEYFLSVTDETAAGRRSGITGTGPENHAHALREALVDMVQDFIDLQRADMSDSLAAMDRAQARINSGLVTTGALTMLCFVLLAWLITRSIRQPARDLVRIASRLEAGDWKPALALAETAERRAGRAVGNEMTRVGQAFGAAAIALEQREQRLAAEHQVARAIGVSLDKSDVASAALRAIAAHVRAEVAVMYGYERQLDVLTPIAAHGVGTASDVAVGEGLPGRAARERRLVRLRDIPPETAFSVKLGYDEASPRDVVAVPITFRDDLIGVLLVASLRELPDASVDFLESACRRLGVGLNNVRSHEQIRRLLAEVEAQSQRIQAQNEALQAQNEEIQAQSEEVQAQNEELQAQGEEIRAQNEQLTEQTEQLRTHSALLAEADQRKTEFLGLLAHELRNPLAGISNSLFVLSRPDLDRERTRAAQAIIGRQTRQLTRLIDDLLDVTRVTRGKVTLKSERVDLRVVVRDCLDDYRAALDNARLSLSAALPDEAVMVRGDRARLCQIIGNLIDNAAKFTDAGKRVSVTLGIDAPLDVARLEIADEGIGIDRAAFSRLFQPFSQGDPNLTRTNGGLGLGLALVKSLVEMHQGTVEAHSEGIGKGARFVVRLPLLADIVACEDAPAPYPGPSDIGSPPCRVLIIEDNADVAESLCAALGAEGHEVRLARSAQEGLRLAYGFRPDVLLCDIGLPVVDGYEVARRFRADDALASVYLVAVTGYASDKDRDDAARAGFDRHLPKPPDLEELRTVLAEAAARRARHARHARADSDLQR